MGPRSQVCPLRRPAGFENIPPPPPPPTDRPTSQPRFVVDSRPFGCRKSPCSWFRGAAGGPECRSRGRPRARSGTADLPPALAPYPGRREADFDQRFGPARAGVTAIAGARGPDRRIQREDRRRGPMFRALTFGIQIPLGVFTYFIWRLRRFHRSGSHGADARRPQEGRAPRLGNLVRRGRRPPRLGGLG